MMEVYRHSRTPLPRSQNRHGLCAQSDTRGVHLHCGCMMAVGGDLVI